MKLLKGALYTVVVLGALAGFGWFFVSQLSTGGGQSDELAGVLLAPPSGYALAEHGELSQSAAAAELGQTLRPGTGKVGLHFKRQGAEVYWLVDPESDLIEERAAGPAGTRLQTVWQGGIRERLSWARAHGTLDAPGLPPGERKNLYH